MVGMAAQTVLGGALPTKVDGKEVFNNTYAGLQGQSLVSVSKAGQFMPVTMVDVECTNLPYISDVVQSVQSIFTGYLLQAINYVATVGNVSVKERLAPFNPSVGLGIESNDNAKKNDKKWGLLPKSKMAFALEAAAANTPKPAGTSAGVHDKVLDDIATATNLSVGKIYNVTLRENDQSVTVPITVRLLVSILPSNMLTKLFVYRDSFDMQLNERWHAWREGRIGFWKDLVLCQDLIAKQRKMAITDKSGLGAEILDREANSVKKWFKGKLSISRSTNIAIISDKTLDEIEMELSGKISNSRVRRAIFDNTNLMLLVVVDSQWERVTIYTEGIEAHSTLSVKDIKASNKNSGPDVTEIMRAYMLGTSPQSF